MFDPAIPFVVVEGHTPAYNTQGGEWTQLAMPLSADSLLNPRTRRIASVGFDVLMRTDEFFDALAEFEPRGMVVSQWEREPAAPARLADQLRMPHIYQFMKGKGIALAFYLPHRNETGQVIGPDTEVVGRSHARVAARFSAP